MVTVKKLLPASHIVRLETIRTADKKDLHAKKLCLSCTEGLHILSWKEINYCVAEDNYCHIHLLNGKTIFLAKTLRAIEQHLPNHEFVRIHRGHLVRMDQITGIFKDEIEIQSGKRLPIARDRHKEVVRRIRNLTQVV